MSHNVVSLHGEEPPQSGKPVAGVVAELERLLEAARAGEIVGLAIVARHASSVVAYSYAGAVKGYALIGGLECVKQELVAAATRPS